MSYILEALKKSQAERQLGSAPSIHTMPIPTALPQQEREGRMQLYLAVGGVLLALAVAVLWWRQPVPTPASGTVASAPAVLVATPVTQPPVIIVPKAAPAPIALPSPQPAAVAPPPKPVNKPVPQPVSQPAPSPVATPAAVPAPVAVPAASDPAAVDDSVPLMAQLPEAVQRELPKVAFGGYMYSKNPADRLVLIDKLLRREGEEVAPGLILEQLQRRAAVMNYRGTRYRVPL